MLYIWGMCGASPPREVWRYKWGRCRFVYRSRHLILNEEVSSNDYGEHRVQRCGAHVYSCGEDSIPEVSSLWTEVWLRTEPRLTQHIRAT